MTYAVVWEHHAMNEFRWLRAIDPVGAKACAAAVRELAEEPRPEAAHALGSSGYYRLPVGLGGCSTGRTGHCHRSCAQGRPDGLSRVRAGTAEGGTPA